MFVTIQIFLVLNLGAAQSPHLTELKRLEGCHCVYPPMR
jgi:hypothetical protein